MGRVKSGGGYVKGYTGDNWKSPQWPKLRQFEQQNEVVLDYNLKYKTDVYVSILIKVCVNKMEEEAEFQIT